jgi:predicted nucleic acid-binding protein
MKAAEGRVLIDTNFLICATLESDPRSKRAREMLLASSTRERFTSVQNLAEMYPNLTRPRMESQTRLQVLPLTGDVQTIALELCEKYGITRQRYYDAQLAATMIVHGIRTLFTENDRDFKEITEISAVNPFTA